MSARTDQLEALGLLAAHEAAMADFYSALGARFTECADLFLTLATAERDHARRITDFAALVSAGTVRVDPGRFPAAALLASLDCIREEVRRAQAPTMTLSGALSVAHELEDALIESRYYESVEGDSAELKELVERLSRELAEHRALLERAKENAGARPCNAGT
jgi:rubrerythrin